MIHFRHAVAFDLQRLDLVAVLDGLEMLPGVGHHQQEQAGESDAELAHLAAAARIFQLHEARVVDRLGKVDLGRADPERWLRWPAAGSLYRRCCCHYATPSRSACACSAR